MPTTAQLVMLPVGELVPSTTRAQARRRARFTEAEITELAESVAAQGVIEPIVARPRPDLGAFHAEIVAGERRWLAARAARLVEVPVMLRDYSDADALAVQLIENLQRKGLDPIEEAETYADLMRERGLKADDLVAMTGKSRSWVYDRLKLLQLGDEARRALESGQIDVSRAIAVSRYQGEQAAFALEAALDPHLTVRDIDDEVEQRFRAPPAPRPSPAGIDREAAERRQAERTDHQRKQAAEEARRLAIFTACAACALGPLDHDEIVDLAREALADISPEALQVLFPAGLPDPAQLDADDLGRVIRMARVEHCLATWSDDDALLALAKRLKVNAQKIGATSKRHSATHHERTAE